MEQEASGTLLTLRIDCTHPGCRRCVAQIVVSEGHPPLLRFRAKHDGNTHEVALPLAAIMDVLTAAPLPLMVGLLRPR